MIFSDYFSSDSTRTFPIILLVWRYFDIVIFHMILKVSRQFDCMTVDIMIEKWAIIKMFPLSVE